ncbi:TPA: hypothetical protein DCW38_02765 [candidate division WOR-3 bacterium]|jgi:uncharacterized protein (DUF2062 family)|uniref:DUF2062 domain-containing protein n=1 Tax=candidate division WOR-3 bacterium TaxID=2052148 RepID=A0A350H969_UNCW3|nr:hypothetical protein [candidate division WOR-3 bacterium]
MFKQFKRTIKDIVISESSPLEISAGFGIGIFIGFLPFYGFQTILSILAAVIIKRVNKLSLIFATQLFLPFVIPFVVALNFLTGSLILYRRVSIFHIEDISDVLVYFKPILLGSIPNGLLVGLISTAVLNKIINFIRRRNNAGEK